jgi:hypothetical protein
VQISSIARLALGLILAPGGIAAVLIFLKKHGMQ